MRTSFRPFRPIFSITLMLMSALIAASQNTIYINPDLPPNPPTKSGYALIFDDEFDTFDHKKWDKSTSIAPGDDTPCCFYRVDNMREQVSVSDGKCIIKNEASTPFNNDCHFACATIQPVLTEDEFGQPIIEYEYIFPECERGVGGEIKTFTNIAADPPYTQYEHFFSYEFPVGSFVEIRAKVPSIECNAGAAFWLYGNGQEIDVFETNGGGNPENFTSGFYNGRWIDGQYYGPYESYTTFWNWLTGKPEQRKITHRGISIKSNQVSVENIEYVWDEMTQSYIEMYQPQFDASPNLDLSQGWFTYGVEYTEDQIKYYINNEVFYTYDVASFEPGSLRPIGSKTIRLGSGAGTEGGNFGCHLCPSTFEIEYVRVYKPNDRTFLDWAQKFPTLNKNSNTDFFYLVSPYIPEVVYTWEGDAFEIIQHPWNPESKKLIRVKPETNRGESYPLTVTATYPDGTEEQITTLIYVQDIPPVPEIESVSQLCQGTVLKVEVLFPSLVTPNSECAPGQTGHYQYSLDNENWTDITENPFSFNGFLGNGTFWVRAINCFGPSNAVLGTYQLLVCTSNESDDRNYHNADADTQNTNESNLIIYPNPTTDKAFLSGLKSNQLFNYSIMTLEGSIIASGSQNSHTNDIDFSSFSKGMYILEVRSSDNTIHRQFRLLKL